MPPVKGKTTDGDWASDYVSDAADVAKRGVDQASDSLGGMADQMVDYVQGGLMLARDKVAELGGRRSTNYGETRSGTPSVNRRPPSWSQLLPGSRSA